MGNKWSPRHLATRGYGDRTVSGSRDGGMDHRTGSAVLYGQFSEWYVNGQGWKTVPEKVRFLFGNAALSGFTESAIVSDDDTQERHYLQINNYLSIPNLICVHLRKSRLKDHIKVATANAPHNREAVAGSRVSTYRHVLPRSGVITRGQFPIPAPSS